jgi:hypothetical protein
VKSRAAQKSALAEQEHDDYLVHIEFRPNDLASPRTARLTDDLPKISKINRLR